MKRINFVMLFSAFIISSFGQTSKSEKTGFWDQGSSWVGSVFPGSVSSGTITATSNVIVINGTIESKKNITFDLSNVSIKANDTLVILGNLTLTGSILSNNGVLIVLGDVTNALSNNSISSTGKLVVTGDYSNGLGSNAFTGPSYVFGGTSGFLISPNVKSEANLIANDPGLYNYVNGMMGALPIELLSFRAETADHTVLLTWKTATEINNDYFKVERSMDGKNFNCIASPKGAGNSMEIKSYSYTDANPFSGTSYYRLSQVDYDGKTVQFNIVPVQIEQEDEIKVYPNPSVSYLFINVPLNNYLISIKDAQGIERKNEISFQQVEGRECVNVSELRTGIYFLELKEIEGNQSRLLRFIKS